MTHKYPHAIGWRFVLVLRYIGKHENVVTLQRLRTFHHYSSSHDLDSKLVIKIPDMCICEFATQFTNKISQTVDKAMWLTESLFVVVGRSVQACKISNVPT